MIDGNSRSTLFVVVATDMNRFAAKLHFLGTVSISIRSREQLAEFLVGETAPSCSSIFG